MDDELLNIETIIKSEFGVAFIKQEADDGILENENIEFTDPLELVENIKAECVDPLEFSETNKHEDSTNKNEDSSNLQNDGISLLVATVMKRLRNPFQLEEIETESETALEIGNRSRRKKPQTSNEEETRLLRQRLLQMKNRLMVQLELPEKAKAVAERSRLAIRMRRQTIRATETPEQAVERRKYHAAQVQLSRKRLVELETAEQRRARIARRNEKKKLRLQARHARETPEERAARRERERMYREKSKQQAGRLAMHTGKIRTRKNRRIDHDKKSTDTEK